ncbi:MAG TPA: SDR family NAD(P)-dependent oxidoreductase [Terriglobales bacterium]|nr:SDR family NAD(P)-dependent oxidoreductase [Terriglobales bacterium]
MQNRSTALVSGANSGIGRVIASRLAKAGYDVALNFKVDGTGAEKIAQELQEQYGCRSISVYADVGNAQEVDGMFRTVIDRFGRLDALVNNAGVQVWKPLLELEESEWDFVINTNLKGCFLCTQRAARHMKEHGSGVIVNIGSGCNKVPFPNLSAYTASKGGIEMLTRCAAVELGPLGIRVNCVAPGAIDTERTKLEMTDFAKSWAEITPLRRIGAPDDVASAVEFLLSDQASFISGQTLWVDGAAFTQPRWPSSDNNA